MSLVKKAEIASDFCFLNVPTQVEAAQVLRSCPVGEIDRLDSGARPQDLANNLNERHSTPGWRRRSVCLLTNLRLHAANRRIRDQLGASAASLLLIGIGVPSMVVGLVKI